MKAKREKDSDEMTWSSKKKVQARGMVEGRGIATITAERSE